LHGKGGLPRGAWLLVALVWGVFLVGVFKAGKPQLFQAWPYYYFTAGAGVVLVALAAKAALWPSSAMCDCGHHHAGGEACEASGGEHAEHDHGDHAAAAREGGMAATLVAIGVLALISLPVVAGIIVPQRGLNSLAVAQRLTGDVMDSEAILAAARSEKRRWNAGAKDYQEVNQIDILEMGRDHPGLKVRTIGFVYRSKQMPDDVIGVARFQITCCAADAQPIPVPVRVSNAADFKADTWIEVRGVVERQDIRGRQTTVVVVDPKARPADGILLIKRPRNEYIR
jgi:uncharacterized repeat protein (TIGR03943 family)